MGILSFIIAILSAIVAIIIAYFILREKDPIKSAFSGLMSSFIVLIGGLGSQSIEFKASMPKHDTFGFPIEVTEFIVSGTPTPIWITAFLSIVVLLGWFSKLINDDRGRNITPP